MWAAVRVPAGPLLDPFKHDDAAAAFFGVSRQTVAVWRRYGIGSWKAERLAVTAGTVPEVLWPGWERLPDKTMQTTRTDTT